MAVKISKKKFQDIQANIFGCKSHCNCKPITAQLQFSLLADNPQKPAGIKRTVSTVNPYRRNRTVSDICQ